MIHRWDVWDMAEIFVVSLWRRAGVGRSAARQLFAEVPGDWEYSHFRLRAGGEGWASVCADAALSGVVTVAGRCRSRPDVQIVPFSNG